VNVQQPVVFLTPGNGIVSQKTDIGRGGSAIINVASLVHIRVCREMPSGSLLDVDTMKDSLLQIPNESFNCCPVCISWLVHELG
jgi:hypothetical protein